MKLDVRQVGNVAVVDISGKITSGEGDLLLRQQVFDLLDNDGTRVLLNLEKVSHVDSAGLGQLAACYKRAQEKKSAVKLLTPSPKLCELLRLIKFDELFETFHDEREALASF